MACFLVPVAEAIVTTVVAKAAKKKETNPEVRGVSGKNQFEAESSLPFSRKLKWLTNMLWGGSVLLAFEHVWHGEVVPWFPFLTAAGDPAEASVMLHEMMTVGVSMAVLVTAAWGVMLLVAKNMEKKTLSAPSASN